jgi:hypothetical protein
MGSHHHEIAVVVSRVGQNHVRRGNSSLLLDDEPRCLLVAAGRAGQALRRDFLPKPNDLFLAFGQLCRGSLWIVSVQHDRM